MFFQKLPARLLWLALTLTSSAAAQQNHLLVISIDGLDHRWLRDADELGIRIPTLRRLMREGARADGMIGVVPTVTWPSHTTMISGVVPAQHGIISNNQPGKPGQRWWYVSFLKAKTLWHATHERGLKSGAVWWPVTAGADIDFNMPEFWDDPAAKPRELDPVARNSTPGLADEIRKAYPSFGTKFFTDREKVLAARYIIETHKPALFLLHLGELDSAQHNTGAFSDQAKKTLEHQDALLRELIAVLPPRSYVAVVADHGFESERRIVRPQALLAEAGINAEVTFGNGLFAVNSEKAAEHFRGLIGKPGSLIAREVDRQEVARFDPEMGEFAGVFETAFEVFARPGDERPAVEAGNGSGHHGMWPARADYRASFLLWGPGVKPGVIGEVSMLDLAPTFAEILGLSPPPGPGKSVWSQVR